MPAASAMRQIDKLGDAHAERVRDADEDREARVRRASLDPPHVGRLDVHRFGCLFDRPAAGAAQLPHTARDDGGDPPETDRLPVLPGFRGAPSRGRHVGTVERDPVSRQII